MRMLPFFKPKKGFMIAGGGLETSSGGGGGGSYTLPTATASRLGGVKIGSGISVTNDGTISATGGGGGGSYVEHVSTIDVPSSPNVYGVGAGSALATINAQAGKSYLVTIETSWNVSQPNGVMATTYAGDPSAYYIANNDGSAVLSFTFVASGNATIYIYAKWKSVGGHENMSLRYVEIDTPVSQ